MSVGGSMIGNPRVREGPGMGAGMMLLWSRDDAARDDAARDEAWKRW
jgi:hypothetical protein